MSDKQGAPNLPPLNGGGGGGAATNNGGGGGGTSSQQQQQQATTTTTVNLQQVLANAQSLNVLTTDGGQQFVITSQVPGLAQVLQYFKFKKK